MVGGMVLVVVLLATGAVLVVVSGTSVVVVVVTARAVVAVAARSVVLAAASALRAVLGANAVEVPGTAADTGAPSSRTGPRRVVRNVTARTVTAQAIEVRPRRAKKESR